MPLDPLRDLALGAADMMTMSADPANTYLDYIGQVYGCEIDGAGFVDGLTKDIG